MADHRQPGHEPDDDRDDGRRAAQSAAGADVGAGEAAGEDRAPDRAGLGLVWPPTEEELDTWEVVPLGGDSIEPPPASPAAPPHGDPARGSPSTDRPAARAVVVRAVSQPPAGSVLEAGDPVPATPSAEEPERNGAPRRRAAGSTVVLLVTVPLLAVLSAAAGFVAAIWVVPSLSLGARADPSSSVLIVESPQPGASVLVNGEPWGTTPLRLSLTGGETRIQIGSEQGPRESRAGTGGAVAPAVGTAGQPGGGSESGSVLVRSSPPGARVVLGGRFRGVTPVSVGGIVPGLHEVEISRGSVSTLRRVNVSANRVSTLDVDLRTVAPRSPAGSGSARTQPGYLTVRSTLPLQVMSGGRPVGTSSSPRIPLAPGTHDLEFVAEAFEFSTSRRVDVRAGNQVTVTIPVPNGRANFNAQPWAEVWLEGRRLGETPLGNVELPIGIHEVEFRHPQLGTRRERVVVRARTSVRSSVRFTP